MDISSGDFGVGGSGCATIVFTFTGKLGPPFIDFLEYQKHKLGLGLVIEKNTPHEVKLIAWGSEVLLGAFEVSCCLGPINSSIKTWSAKSAEQLLRSR